MMSNNSMFNAIYLTLPSRSVYRSNTKRSQNKQSTSDYFYINIYLPLIDNVLVHLRDRFGPTQQKVIHLSALIPAFIGQYTQVQPAVELYHNLIEEDQVKAEFELWRTQWLSRPLDERNLVNSAVLAIQNCNRITKPNIYTLLQILATLPVTTAQPERVFSKVEKTASATRAAMNEDRLEALVMIQTHRDKTPTADDILDCFAASTQHSFRRFILKVFQCVYYVVF